MIVMEHRDTGRACAPVWCASDITKSLSKVPDPCALQHEHGMVLNGSAIGIQLLSGGVPILFGKAR